MGVLTPTIELKTRNRNQPVDACARPQASFAPARRRAT